jgi:aspartate aminotransferase/aminotransferase
MFAKRMNYIRASGIRKVFDLAAKIKDPINLSIGQPDFPTPKKVKNNMIKAIKEDKTKYTQTQGIPELRKELLKKVNTESVMITSGVCGGLLLAFSVLLDKNDELIMFDPYFVIYPDLCEFLGAKSRIVKTKNDFSIDFKALEKAISKKTKAIMLNSPCNPTGYVLSKKEVKKLAKIAKKHNLWVFSDEIYKLCFLAIFANFLTSFLLNT